MSSLSHPNHIGDAGPTIHKALFTKPQWSTLGIESSHLDGFALYKMLRRSPEANTAAKRAPVDSGWTSGAGAGSPKSACDAAGASAVLGPPIINSAPRPTSCAHVPLQRLPGSGKRTTKTHRAPVEVPVPARQKVARKGWKTHQAPVEVPATTRQRWRENACKLTEFLSKYL